MLRYLIAAALLAVTSLAHARDWPSAGGWDIAEVGSDACIMALEYEGEGETLLALGIRTDGGVLMTVSNYKWSTVEKQVYKLAFYLNGQVYNGGASTGFKDGIRRGFATTFEPDFIQHFGAAGGIKIVSEDGVLIDHLDLDGSAAGLAQVRRCVTHLKTVAAAEAREKARLAHIPTDPFATVSGAPAEPGPAVVRAQPRAAVESLITSDDYPEPARSLGQRGTVRFKLKVGVDGRVGDCQVTAATGSASLDAATCRLMRSRARFTPARDESGKTVDDEFLGSYTWVP